MISIFNKNGHHGTVRADQCKFNCLFNELILTNMSIALKFPPNLNDQENCQQKIIIRNFKHVPVNSRCK